MRARVRLVRCARSPLRKSCVSRARNAGESAFVRSAQPSAEIARVECAKCRPECDVSGTRAILCGDRACRVREMRTGDLLVQLLEDENWRLCSTTLVRGVSGELEDENW